MEHTTLASVGGGGLTRYFLTALVSLFAVAGHSQCTTPTNTDPPWFTIHNASATTQNVRVYYSTGGACSPAASFDVPLSASSGDQLVTCPSGATSIYGIRIYKPGSWTTQMDYLAGGSGSPDCYTSPVTYPIYGWGSNVYCLGIWSGYCNTGSCTTTCLDDCWIRIDDQSGGVCN